MNAETLGWIAIAVSGASLIAVIPAWVVICRAIRADRDEGYNTALTRDEVQS